MRGFSIRSSSLYQLPSRRNEILTGFDCVETCACHHCAVTAVPAVQDYRDWTVVDQFDSMWRRTRPFNANTARRARERNIRRGARASSGGSRVGKRGPALAGVRIKVNCETTSMSPPTASKPGSSCRRRRQTPACRRRDRGYSASPSVSPRPTPRRITKPRPISAERSLADCGPRPGEPVEQLQRTRSVLLSSWSRRKDDRRSKRALGNLCGCRRDGSHPIIVFMVQ